MVRSDCEIRNMMQDCGHGVWVAAAAGGVSLSVEHVSVAAIHTFLRQDGNRSVSTQGGVFFVWMRADGQSAETAEGCDVVLCDRVEVTRPFRETRRLRSQLP
jgi:hypothetical protein